ncbi:C2 domain-containing protein At1g53590-like isoform X1 [Solanum stenotomum]|uniref:C2 domain-containing protein At1g53590-like isoform X1 n=1 Tax=Solanum stenotomum TaxID=172797 RepID=UPI0020D16256|nr:C2 domain-containing protein At1g53590-like isoform X1 [Solanum stenotomum]XP_049404789.1 C2 domain-containing protein At1g53590-like isoform X1 [Solanum stenotomum]
MASITEVTILHHVGIVLIVLWLLNSFNYGHPLVYFISLIYLYLVNEQYVTRLKKKLQFEEKRQSNQRRVLSDSETVRWLNHALEKIWPVCMENIVSQKILLPIIPWFMQKYKPWTVKDIAVQSLYLGRSPPMFTEMRVLRESTGDDHLVLELGMNFRSADDMSAILAAKLKKRLGFGMVTKLHLLGMHIEGKVLIGVKFLRKWPFLGRLRVCFAEPPYFQMTVKPIFTHGIDVTELPGVAGWLDNLLSVAFEQTLVEPNMLVVDMEKFVSPQQDKSWFSIDAKEPIAHVILEVLEAEDLKPADLNGLSDPYVKGHLGPYRFKTRTQKKTLAPQWQEEFKIPVCSWESPNDMLNIDVCDKDHFSSDETLGDNSINICDYRDGQRHDIWLSLRNVKTGRLRIAITVVEGSEKCTEQSYERAKTKTDNKQDSNSDEMDTAEGGFLPTEMDKQSSKVADTYEPINIEGQKETGMWVHHPGSEVPQVWEPRKGKSRVVDGEVLGSDADSMGGSFKLRGGGSTRGDDSDEGSGSKKTNLISRGINKIGSIFHKSQKSEDRSGNLGDPVPSPQANLKAVSAKETRVNLIMNDSVETTPRTDSKEAHEGYAQCSSSNKSRVRDKAKNILRHAVSRKSSRKSKGELEPTASERDLSVESDSSSDDFTPSVGSPLGRSVSGRFIASTSIENPNGNTVKSSELVDDKGNMKTSEEVVHDKAMNSASPKVSNL